MQIKVQALVALSFILSSSIGSAAGNSSAGGRFQVLQLSDMRRDQVLIDSQAGRIWHRTCRVALPDNECAYSAWVQDAVEGLNVTPKQSDKIAKDIEAEQANAKNKKKKAVAEEEE